jgi:hypothetical protein
MVCDQGRIGQGFQRIIVKGVDFMTITVPLEPQTEAKLIALAQERGLTADEFLRVALQKIIAEATEGQGPEVPVWHLGGAGALHRREIYDDAR